jgi:hypothetical protein
VGGLRRGPSSQRIQPFCFEGYLIHIRCVSSGMRASVQSIQVESFSKCRTILGSYLALCIFRIRDAATKKYGHGKLHQGNLALVHPDSGLGSREGNGSDKRLWAGSEAVVNEYLRQTIEANPSTQIIIGENKKDMHDDPNLDLDAVITKFTKHVRYFGHPGKYHLEVLPKEQEWCIRWQDAPGHPWFLGSNV